MGSAATSLSSPSPEQSDNTEKKKKTRRNTIIDMSLTHREITSQRTLVRANHVAPIIIKNCNEEYQHITDLTEPVSYGRISEFTQEHALIENQYFLVEDVTTKMDQLATMDQYKIPNLRACRGDWPIYGLGQPSQDGLAQLLASLKEEGHQNLLLFNLRAEPVLFARRQYDLVPYSLRSHYDSTRCAYGKDYNVQQINAWEAKIRKETSDIAALLTEHQEFYFYDHHEGFYEDPIKISVAYEDDLAVTEEVYHRHSFANPGMRYCRLPMLTVDGAPHERIFDDFLAVFHRLPNFFVRNEPCTPAMLFTSRSGVSRATYGMILGSLIMAQKNGFSRDPGKSSDLKRQDSSQEVGELRCIKELVKYLPNGQRIKQEVDRCINMSDELFNITTTIAEYRAKINPDNQDQTDQERRALVEQCRVQAERYFYLICFNAYLHEQYDCSFGTSFLEWMQEQPQLYHILHNLNMCERDAPPSLLDEGHRSLVADDLLGLDVLSSYNDVQVSNFRGIASLPVYGMAQPNKSGLDSIVSHLLTKKEAHPTVVICNLREDLVIELDGVTYCWRNSHQPDKPLNFPGISGKEIEEKETELKKSRKKKKKFNVIPDLDRPIEHNREFGTFLTPHDMYELLENSKVHYHRIPIPDNKAPMEHDFDALMSAISSLKEIHSDEDGPALLFHCRTGKGRTTLAMSIAGLIYCHQRGFPYGTKPGEEERVSLPNASYTKGNFELVRELVRRIPEGQQVKREVDFVLDQVSDTMTPMHYHIREIIFVTLNKVKKTQTEAEREYCIKRSFDFLERYIYLILFNTYLHCERRNGWKRQFTSWMKDVAAKAGVYDLLDSLGFPELDITDDKLAQRRYRWQYQHPNRTKPTLFM